MPPIKVLVVDDSAVIRRIVTTVLDEDRHITVVGTAGNGQIALDKLDKLDPDLVTLDIEMPVMDGLETLRQLKKRRPRLPVIMFSTLTENGAAATLDALTLGASDYVTKPSNAGSFGAALEAVRAQLVPKVRALGGRVADPFRTTSGAGAGGGTGSRRATPTTPPRSGLTKPPNAAAGACRPTAPGRATQRPGLPGVTARTAGSPLHPEVLAIGCSTGGPDALTTLLAGLPADLGVPIVIVQHMPPVFTRLFAQRLDRASGLSVREAEHGDELRPGLALLAPGDWHLSVGRRSGKLIAALDQSPQENFCRPAVDVLFRSVAAMFGGNSLAVVLTGMGHDGRSGAEDIVRAGGSVLAQDEATSVVWGMPGAVSNAALTEEVLPLARLAPTIIHRIRASGGTAARSHAEAVPTR